MCSLQCAALLRIPNMTLAEKRLSHTFLHLAILNLLGRCVKKSLKLFSSHHAHCFTCVRLLQYAALLRIPNMTLAEKRTIVEDTITALKLNACADTRCGDDRNRGALS